jgi:peptide/nickel transport system ATP-binding protein
MSVKEIVSEPLEIHNIDNKEEKILDILERVELNPPEKYLNQKPNQLSGGEKQRVSIARALVIDPEIILADEPVSMLDVSTQAAILNLLSELIEEMDVAMMYISHDLSTVSYICDEINVMYLGRVIESALTMRLLKDPKHPYSKELINAIPIPDPDYDRIRTSLDGAVPSPEEAGAGCRFKSRCPDRMEICDKAPLDVVDGNRTVACHLYYDHETTQTDRDKQLEVDL